MLRLLRGAVAFALAVAALAASEHHGIVRFGGLPVPGATVTASSGDKKLATVTDEQGAYSFTDLPDGSWTFHVEMLCFSPMTQDVVVSQGAPATEWELKLLPLDAIKASAVAPAAPPPAVELPTKTEASKSEPVKTEIAKGNAPVAPPSKRPGFQRAELNASPGANPATPGQRAEDKGANDEELNEKASDGFLVNGSVNNGASSPFAQFAAFGNNRRGLQNLYNGSLGLIFDNSVLDARSYSLTGQDTAKPAYDHLQAVATFGGIMKIPHLLHNGPIFFIGFQWTRNSNASTQTGLMPTALQRAGDFSQTLDPLGRPVQLLDPSNGQPFTGNSIPHDRLSPQATALLNLYPLPNFQGSARYNYQIPILGALHQDAMQTRLNKSVNNKNQLYGGFSFQSIRTDNPNIFNFLDTSDTFGLTGNINWRHTFNMHLYSNLTLTYSRQSVRTTPFFDNRQNVSGDAGIFGNNQEPRNWGPPALTFASGITPLSDAQSSFNRNQTGALSYAMLWLRGRHNVTFGGDYKRLQFNYLSQQDPRGTFTFTGAAAGYDFADFLLGVPDTSSIAFGNADKYFRSSNYDAYVTDDWRVSPELTVNAGVRWEYGSPITELYGRLVNLDIASGYTAVAPVVASNAIGALTGQHYPDSLIRPDKHAFQPRVAMAWRPLGASSMVVRAGYGVYFNTSVYQSLAIQMAQQSPLSKSLSVQNSAADPLTLENGFNASPGITPNTFAVDPNFLVGYSQNWQVSVQRDLPGSLVMTATYLGIKGTRGMQEFLPNTVPYGAVNPCPACPTGFAYLTSGGNSTREAGQFQLRRRLHSGLTATLQYVYSKSIDDSALGGRGQGASVIAQNWRDLSAERGLSSFDQRHLLTASAQYTSGMGMHGGTLLTGWRGALLKEWNLATQITAGSGLPLTPIYLTAVNGTGVTGSIRPDYDGLPIYDAPPGLHLNPAAFIAPAPGQWGTVGRDSVTGPSQFALSASLGRTFRWKDRYNFDARVDATNALNHVSYTAWNTVVSSNQFGVPVAANAMRSIQTTLRLRF